MATDRFMIAPLNSGLQKDLKPWLIPDDAFEKLQNAYVFRGRVRKRFGASPLNTSGDQATWQYGTRLRILVGTTDGNGDLAGTAPGTVFGVGQAFSVGDDMFTVDVIGFPATMLSTGAGAGTFDTVTGAFAITGADATTSVYFYPAEPVMGFATYEHPETNDEETFAFDTQFAYQYTAGGWERLSAEAVAGDALWTGANSDFFWCSNYRGIEVYERYLFVSNFFDGDRIRYWDGSAWNTLGTDLNAAGDFVVTARIILPFKDRLMLFNTVQNIGGTDRSIPNGVVWSQNGSPIDATAWRQDVKGKGGFANAPTTEAIITAISLKDRLIVYFERSTWEFVYTNNDIDPFIWQKINTELGAESTFSIVPFDKIVIGVGQTGIHACNGANVERIDNKIPDEVFELGNANEGTKRVFGIRDYYTELVYWTYPSPDKPVSYPDRVLVYNYKTGSWAEFDDSITAFGYFQNQDSATWETSGEAWQEAGFSWDSGVLQSKFQNIIAGNQQGFTFLVQPDDETRNSISLQIDDITVVGYTVSIQCVNHNLRSGDFILIENCSGITQLNGVIFRVYSIETTISFVIKLTVDDNYPTGTYTGGGTITRVSQIDILTKQYNFYVDKGVNASINKVDFLVDKEGYEEVDDERVGGSVTVDYYVSSSNVSSLTDGTATGALLGSGVLETFPYELVPLEEAQSRLWHPIYPMADGECIQLRIYLNDEQMREPLTSLEDFVLHAMCFSTNPTSSRLQ